MHSLSASELLDVWEQGIAMSTPRRSLLLLMAAWPEQSWTELAGESIGQRNSRLLSLRTGTFGVKFSSVTSCPVCIDKLEFTFTETELQITTQTTQTAYILKVDEYEVTYRLPTSQDLLSLANAENASEKLLLSCLIAAKRNEAIVEVDQLPTHVTEAVEEAMVQWDPLADIQMTLTCPACLHTWQAGFDIGSFFWQEIEAWAFRLLQEVHLIASAYGWSEEKILAMSARKRHLYLKMIYG